MSVRLPDGDYTVRKRHRPGGVDEHLQPLPLTLGPETGTVAGARRETADGTWSLRLDPSVWPLNRGDYIYCPAQGITWTVQTAEFLGSAHTLDVAYVRVTASRRDVTEMDSHPPAPWDYDTTVGTTP